MISLKGLNKAEVLAALYNASGPQGMGFLPYDPAPMPVEEAAKLLDQRDSEHFGYLKGRVMGVNLSGDELDPRLYDRDNGKGAAQRAVDSLRSTGEPDNLLISTAHAEGKAESIIAVREAMGIPTTRTKTKETVTVTLGLDDVADVLKPAVDKADKYLNR